MKTRASAFAAAIVLIGLLAVPALAAEFSRWDVKTGPKFSFTIAGQKCAAAPTAPNQKLGKRKQGRCIGIQGASLDDVKLTCTGGETRMDDVQTVYGGFARLSPSGKVVVQHWYTNSAHGIIRHQTVTISAPKHGKPKGTVQIRAATDESGPNPVLDCDSGTRSFTVKRVADY